MSTGDSVDAESHDRESETSEGTEDHEDIKLISLTDILQDETNDDDSELFDMLCKPELHAGPNFKTRPDPAHENRDPTRP